MKREKRAVAVQGAADFITGVALARGQELVNGLSAPPLRQPRPIGGWSFDVPERWDTPLDDVAVYR